MSDRLDRANIISRTLSGFAWQGGSKGLIQVFSWVATVFVARMLDPSDYGIVAIAGVFFVLAAAVTEMGLAAGLIQSEHCDIELRDSIFTLTLFAAIVLYVVLHLASPVIAVGFDTPEVEAILKVGGVGIIFGATKCVPFATAMRSLRA